MPASHHSVFFRPGALPDAQPTASERWRQITPQQFYLNIRSLRNINRKVYLASRLVPSTDRSAWIVFWYLLTSALIDMAITNIWVLLFTVLMTFVFWRTEGKSAIGSNWICWYLKQAYECYHFHSVCSWLSLLCLHICAWHLQLARWLTNALCWHYLFSVQFCCFFRW